MGKFNLNELGVSYTILDKGTEQSSTMRVIDFTELKAIVGEFVGADYSRVELHIKEVLKYLDGFVRSPYDISWYAAKKEEFELSRAIMQARHEGNMVVVVEILPSDEVDNAYVES
jgi:hypothetical protein